MCGKQFLIFLTFISIALSKEARYRNFEISGYELGKLVFSKKIREANYLINNLPEENVDKIVIKGEFPVLYEDAVNLKELDELVLDNCRISEIQPGAINVGDIRKISLNNNDITEIKARVFSNSTVYDLVLSRNKINKIDSNAFDNMPNLIILNLGWNEINHIDSKWFKGTPELSYITMHYNQIQELPEKVFHHLAEQREAKNVVTSLGIVLDHNQIKKVHRDAFKGLKNIEKVWLHDNLLQNLDENTWDGIHLNRLTLENNQFKCFGENLDKILSADRISVEPNPLDCNCLEKLTKWSQKNKKNIDLFYSENDCKLQDIRRRIDNLNKAFDNY